MKKYRVSIWLWLMFEMMAVILWLWLDNVFYLWNFTYIGTAIALGVALYSAGFKCKDDGATGCWSIYADLSWRYQP